MSDLLAAFWVHPVIIERFVGAGAYGDLYDPPETVQGWVRDGTQLVADGTGQQVASSAQVALPATVNYVPTDSRVTLPPQFAAPGQTRRTTVIASAHADGGGLPTPDHHEIALK